MLPPPIWITQIPRSDAELEALALFSVLMDEDIQSSTRLFELLFKNLGMSYIEKDRFPFTTYRDLSMAATCKSLTDAGFVNEKARGQTIYELVRSKLDLRTCSDKDLEAITGITSTMSKFFISHSRATKGP